MLKDKKLTQKLSLCRITTYPLTLLVILKGQLKFMKQQGFEVVAVSSGGELLEQVKKQEEIEVISISMTRAITPLKDLISLLRLYILFKKRRFYIVHSHTPKAGLLGMWAAWMARVPVRMHTFAGTPLMGAQGIKRIILKVTERLTSWFSTSYIAVSYPLKDWLISQKLCASKKIKVLLSGTSNGLDIKKFSKERYFKQGFEVRKSLGIPKDGVVLGYIGRIVKEKGISELIKAFKELSELYKDLYLIIVGPFESSRDPLPPEILKVIDTHPRVHHIDFRQDIQRYLASLDIFVFPSYREGFSTTLLQAGAMELAIITTDVIGCNDIIEDGTSGILIPPRQITPLKEAIQKLYHSSELRESMGKHIRKRIEREIPRPEEIWEALEKEYRRSF